MEADSVLLGVLVFGAGSGLRSAKGRFAGLAADGHFSLPPQSPHLGAYCCITTFASGSEFVAVFIYLVKIPNRVFWLHRGIIN